MTYEQPVISQTNGSTAMVKGVKQITQVQV